jgi:hypothetical protein
LEKIAAIASIMKNRAITAKILVCFITTLTH